MIKLGRSQNPPGFTPEQTKYLQGVIADIYDELNYSGGIIPRVNNLLPNPAHRYWWEYSSVTFTSDTWLANVHLGIPVSCTITASRENNTFNIPTNSPYVMKIINTLPPAGGYYATRFSAEGLKRYIGKKITFTFYAKSASKKTNLYIRFGIKSNTSVYKSAFYS